MCTGMHNSGRCITNGLFKNTAYCIYSISKYKLKVHNAPYRVSFHVEQFVHRLTIHRIRANFRVYIKNAGLVNIKHVAQAEYFDVDDRKIVEHLQKGKQNMLKDYR